MRKLKKDNLSELVYKQISNMILDKAIPAGEKINRKELSEKLGVSQTPVNEAILRFVNEGVIEQKERHGFYLKQFTDSDMKDLFAVRAGLEGVALRLCIENNSIEKLDIALKSFDEFKLPLSEKEYKKYIQTDRIFHEKILLSSENPLIIDYVRNFDFIMKCYHKGLIRPPEETLKEHIDIINAIKEKDAEKSQLLMMDHHLKTMHTLMNKEL